MSETYGKLPDDTDIKTIIKLSDDNGKNPIFNANKNYTYQNRSEQISREVMISYDVIRRPAITDITKDNYLRFLPNAQSIVALLDFNQNNTTLGWITEYKFIYDRPDMTPTISYTPSQSSTITQSYTYTPTQSLTYTPTQSFTYTPTFTTSSTPTFTFTQTPSYTISPTRTEYAYTDVFETLVKRRSENILVFDYTGGYIGIRFKFREFINNIFEDQTNSQYYTLDDKNINNPIFKLCIDFTNVVITEEKIYTLADTNVIDDDGYQNNELFDSFACTWKDNKLTIQIIDKNEGTENTFKELYDSLNNLYESFFAIEGYLTFGDRPVISNIEIYATTDNDDDDEILIASHNTHSLASFDTPSMTRTITNTFSETNTYSETPSMTPTITHTFTETPSMTPTFTHTNTETPAITPTMSETITPSFELFESEFDTFTVIDTFNSMVIIDEFKHTYANRTIGNNIFFHLNNMVA